MKITSTDPRIMAVRNHKLVGKGSCSSIDECLDDLELLKELDLYKVKTPEEAIKWALEYEDLTMEQSLNCRWGEDDDPQLIEYKKWKEKVKK